MDDYKRREDARAEWASSMGSAVRALLCLKNDAGAWLWFDQAWPADAGDDYTAGQQAKAMLEAKLADWRERELGL